MNRLNMRIDMPTAQAKLQIEEFGSMAHSVPIDGLFHDLKYTGLDFSNLELQRERRFGLDVIHVDSSQPVAIVLNKLNEVAVADYTQYANLHVVVKDDGSVILNSFIKQYNPIATVKLIIQGLNTSFNKFDKSSLKEQLSALDILDLEDYINYCCNEYSVLASKFKTLVVRVD